MSIDLPLVVSVTLCIAAVVMWIWSGIVDVKYYMGKARQWEDRSDKAVAKSNRLERENNEMRTLLQEFRDRAKEWK